MSLRDATLFLVLLAAAVVGLTVYEAAQGASMPPLMFLPAGLMLGVLAAWPFLNGWRPFAREAQLLQDCPQCGVQWRPADEEGTMRCPACATAEAA
jgi:hypothetical protein